MEDKFFSYESGLSCIMFCIAIWLAATGIKSCIKVTVGDSLKEIQNCSDICGGRVSKWSKNECVCKK